MSKSRKAETLAESLRRFVADSGMSQYAVAKAADVSPGVVSRFMRRERDIGLVIAGKLAASLGLRIVKGG